MATFCYGFFTFQFGLLSALARERLYLEQESGCRGRDADGGRRSMDRGCWAIGGWPLLSNLMGEWPLDVF